jgi:hypothetical protein
VKEGYGGFGALIIVRYMRCIIGRVSIEREMDEKKWGN